MLLLSQVKHSRNKFWWAKRTHNIWWK